MQVSDNILLSRLKWVLFWRLFVAILALFSVIISQLPLKGALFLQPRFLAVYVILTIACFSNIIYLILLKIARNKLRNIALLQIGADIILTSSLAYCTGGSASIFVSIYFALILAANILISAKAGLFLASVSTILLSLITIIYSFSAAGHFSLPLLPHDYVKNTSQGFKFVFPYLLFFTLIIHFVAYFAGRLVIALNYERLLKARILQNMTSGVLVLSPQGMVLYANPPLQQMLGLKKLLPDNPNPNISLDDFLNSALKLEAEHRKKLLSLSKTSLEQEAGNPGAQMPFMMTLPPSDRQEPPNTIEIKTSLLESDDMKLKGLIIIFNDITLKQKLAEVSKQSEFLNSLREMSLGIAHEIRNPLASIRGGIQEISCQLKPILSEGQNVLIKTIIDESERLNSLVDNFIDFTRDRKPVMQPSDIGDLVNEITKLVEKSIPAGMLIETTLPKEKIICNIDSGQIKQVIYNLIINAVESSGEAVNDDAPPGTRTISIKLFKAAGAASITARKAMVIEISDSGKGIQPQNITRIFEPFFSTKSDGIGLGLSIAKRIIENHGGTITAESSPSQRTTISVWLPRI